jgi:hypothetical protein
MIFLCSFLYMYNLPVQFVLYPLLKQPHGFSLQQLAASVCDAALVLHLHGVLHEIVILDEDLVLLEPLLVASVRVPDHKRAVRYKKKTGTKLRVKVYPEVYGMINKLYRGGKLKN